MATTIQQSFLGLKSNLEITNLQASTVSTRQTNVRGVVENGMDVLDTFLTGSYSRSTMIAPLKEADVDVFVVLDPRYYHHYNGQNGGQAGLLDLVKRTLLKTYTKTPDISRSGQAVSIRFDDFVVDVVPGFNREGGGYLIANSRTNSWISTDPKKHVDLMTEANKAHNGDLGWPREAWLSDREACGRPAPTHPSPFVRSVERSDAVISQSKFGILARGSPDTGRCIRSGLGDHSSERR